jgi:hypothetical protein
MEKPTTKLSAQDRVILFCVATGSDHGSVGIIDYAMQSMAIGGSSRTIARVGRIRSRTAAAAEIGITA